MEQLSIGNIDVDWSGLAPALHIPTEVCENIIDMLYSRRWNPDGTYKHITTLHSCALVCRDWRVRSQRRLFYKVQLTNSTSLQRFSAILDAAQHLRDYVYEVQLMGYHLHNTTSIFALFPAVFAGKLPKLERIDIVHLSEETSETRFPRTPDPPKSRSLPYIPLHPRFPRFLSSFIAVSSLYIGLATFRSFSEFARMLHGLPHLEVLTCISVRWITPGGSHPGADFTKQPDWTAMRPTLPPFAPKLQQLELADMDMYGVERLIWTRGPHLTLLCQTIPLLDSPEESTPVIQQGIDLSSCTGLRTLALVLGPQLSADTHAGFAKELLASWTPQHSDAVLQFRPLYQPVYTRRRFADALRTLGTIVEAVKMAASVGDSQNEEHVQYRIDVHICDWAAERKWWWDHVASCFPTWSRLRRLDVIASTPQDGSDEWANEEEPMQSDPLAALLAVGDPASSSPPDSH